MNPEDPQHHEAAQQPNDQLPQPMPQPGSYQTEGQPPTQGPMSEQPYGQQGYGQGYGSAPQYYGSAQQPYGSVPQPYGAAPQPYGSVPQPYGQSPSVGGPAAYGPYNQAAPGPYGQAGPGPYGQTAPGPYGQAPFGIDPATGAPLSDKSRVVAGLLQLFLGFLGIGRFYIGGSSSTTIGACQLGLFVLGFLLAIFFVGFLLWMALGLWALIDAIVIFTGDVRDGNGRKLAS